MSRREVVLVVVATVVGMLLIEVAARVYYGPLPKSLLDWSNFTVEARRPQSERTDRSIMPDREMGWVGVPNFADAMQSRNAGGLRTMPAMAGGPPILAVGDSFTYGAETRDTQTWPYHLQELLHRSVVNGGEPGYGLDQIVLRAEGLAKSVKPGFVIVSFIADDVQRSELSYAWGREKPYFVLNGENLELRNVPVPPNPDSLSKLPIWEHWIGWSYMANVVRNHLIADQQVYFGDHVRALPPGSGEHLACPLMKRLSGLGIPTLVVAQYAPTGWDHASYGKDAVRISQEVLQCAEKAGLATLDLFPSMDATMKQRGRSALFADRTGHHSAAGNRFVAEQIAADLKKRNLVE